MTPFILKRLGAALVTVFVTTIAVSMLIHLVPGDPVEIMYAQSQGTTPEQLAAIKRELGLDRSVFEQYGMFLSRIVQGDFGKTIRGEQPVLPLLLLRLPYTLTLAAASLALAVLLGLTAGAIAAYRRGSWLDTSVMVVSILGVSVPSFWLGLILMFVFAVRLQWLPVAGTGIGSLILPAVTLGLANAAIVTRLTRSSMVEVFNQDFVRVVRAKGVGNAVILYRHVLRAALIPIVTMLGLQFTYMMGGAIVIENVFAWNGIGRLAIQAIFQRDYPLIQGFILMFAIIVVIISLIVDLLYAWIDPRIRYI